MNKWIAKYILYYPIQYLRRQKVYAYLPDVIKNQKLSINELANIRDEKIREIIKIAYNNCEYYRIEWDKRILRPEDINSYDDLKLLPVINKREILENKILFQNSKINRHVYTRKTSGSTGMTLHFKKDARALAINDAVMWRCYQWYGIDIGARQARFWGIPIQNTAFLRERLKDFILNRIRISAFDITPGSSRRQYERILKFKPAYLYGYTSAIYSFSRNIYEQGIDLNNLKIKAVICTAEKMYSYHREFLESVFDCPIVDEYGSSENGIIAFQCIKGNMHIMSDNLCIEFINERGENVQKGDLGKIIITDLNSYAMPLIRYNIGDLGRPTDEQCACGINLPLMEVVEGRTEDFIRTPDGKLIHAAYLCYTLKNDSVKEFKMHQEDIRTLRVQIVRAQDYSKRTEAILERLLRSKLGDGLIIKFEYLDSIPRESSGKLRYFVSDLRNINR